MTVALPKTSCTPPEICAPLSVPPALTFSVPPLAAYDSAREHVLCPMDEDGIDEHSTGIHVLNSVKAAEDSAHGGAADVLLAVVLDDCAARGAAGKNLLVADHSREGGAATDCRPW